MKKLKLIRGAGGGGKGGGGGSARAAVEANNTLRSRQFAKVIDLICEGEVEGLVGAEISPEHAERSIYFDGVPLRNELGQSNFDVSAFSWAFVPGTQNQPVIPTGGSVASELQVNQEVKAGNTGGGPVVRSIPETYIDSCRVTVSVPRLTTQDTSNGDINGSSVQFAIDVQNNGGGFVQVMAPTISGKTNSEYQRSYEFDLPGTGPWDVRLRRITADATTSVVQNQLYWSTYTKIVKQQMNYPNTALVGLKVDAALFNRIPARAYQMKLLRVRIPVNYNPVTREYVGLWNGAFKVAWTDNPAWCWYDLATNERYGLGEYVDAGNIDKWTLYAIAQYCDKLVPDGYGNSEPRFRCNLYLNTREEALKVLMNFASIFRGIVYWHSNTIFCSQDRPGNPVKLFTPANVIDGVFNYTGSAKQARHTVAMVAWNDPENMYKQTVEYVEDREGILRLGVREAEVTAMGCTSRGQAHRLGKWILLTEREETDTITFKTGLEGCGVMPGEIIQTTDPSRAGERVGGRVLGSSVNKLTLDAPVVLKPGKNYTVAVVLPSGVIEEKGVLWGGSAETSTSTLTLSTPLAQVPQKHAIWIMQTEDLVPELWRVLSTVEVGPNTVEIVALEHIPGKYAAIENNIKLESRPTSSIKVRPGAVTNLVAVTDVKKLNDLEYTTRIFVSWTPPKEGAARYVVTWRRVGGNSKTEIANDPSIDIDDIPAGTFEISVLAENAIGLRGPVTTISHVVSASAVEPDVTGLKLNPNFLGPDCPIIWDRLNWAVKYTVQVLSGTTVVREEITTTNAYIYSYTQNVADGGPRRNLTFKVKAHSWRGASANWATLEASNPAPATPVGLSVESGPGQVSIFAERPTDFDLEGMVVWMHTSAAVPTTDGYIVYKGKDNAFMKTGLQAGIPAYFKVAFYDTFGTAGLNVSSSVTGIPTATGGIVMVDTLPGSPDDVAGQTAVFLDVADTALRGLYGWDGTSWKFTRDGQYLVANSVTADRLNVAQLSTISANLGTMTAGNITLNSQGFIKGGATSYSAGTGFWMGYDGGRYKWRAGVPGSSGVEWTGEAFNVYGPDGALTISSGVVDWGKISGAGKPANGATRNVFTGDWLANSPYLVGDIVLKDGNGWACVVAHTATDMTKPPTAGTGNTWWTLYAAKGSDGVQGLHAITVVVTNETHTLPSTADGTVAAGNYTGSGTFIQVYEGTTPLAAVAGIASNGQFTVGAPTQNPASTITVGARSYSGVTATISDHANINSARDLVVITYPITVRRLDGTSVTIAKTQTISKSKAGTSGAAVIVTPNRAPTFTSTDNIVDPDQSPIIFTALAEGLTNPSYAWSFTRNGGTGTAPTASTSNTYTITQANLGSSRSATVTCTVNGANADTYTIVLLQRSTAGAGATAGASLTGSFGNWDIGAQTVVTVPDGKVGGTALRLGTATTFPIYKTFIAIDPTKKYRTRFWARPSATCNGQLYFSLRQSLNDAGSWGPTNSGRSPYKPGGKSASAHNAEFGAGQWGEYSFIWTAADWQAGVRFVVPEFLNNYNGTAGYWEIQDFILEDVTQIELAKESAAAAEVTLANFSADNMLSPIEKKEVLRQIDAIIAEGTAINGQGAAFGITTSRTNYVDAYNSLLAYVTPLLSDMTSATAIDRLAFRNAFSIYYNRRELLLNDTAYASAQYANWAGVTGEGRPENGATVGATIGTNLGGQFTQASWNNYISNVKIGAANIGAVALTGNSSFSVIGTNTGGNYMDMDARRIKIYNNGVLRVQLGNLDV